MSPAGAREQPGTRQHVCGGGGKGWGVVRLAGGGGAVCSKWPNSPNFPSAAGGLLLAGGGAALRPATASAAPRSRLAGKWVSVQRTAVQRLYSARLYTHPAYLQCNLLKSNCVELAAVGLYKHPPPARARQSGMYLFIFKCSSV